MMNNTFNGIETIRVNKKDISNGIVRAFDVQRPFCAVIFVILGLRTVKGN